MAALWLFAAAVGASALGGMLGMASGIFIVPILSLWFGLDLHVAIGASLVSVIACSCAGAGTFLREGLTNVRLALLLETTTTLGAITGVLLVGVASTRLLEGLFAGILLLSAHQMLGRRREVATTAAPDETPWGATLRLHASYVDQATGQEIPYHVRRLPLGMALMYGAGVISALLGIGSGVLKIPAMDSALRLPIKVSSATSNFMIGVTAAASAGAYFARGAIDPGVAGPVALGSVAGAFVGARVVVGLHAEKLRLFFVCVLVLLSAQMLASAWGLRLVGGVA